MPNRSLTYFRVTSSPRDERAGFPPAPLFKPDVTKRIDRHIDYFGGERGTAGSASAVRRERRP